MKKSVVILGSTGSIGVQSIQVCQSMGYEIVALTADKNISILEKQAREVIPRLVAVADEKQGALLKIALADTHIRVVTGKEGILEAATMECDMVLNAIVGMAGLSPTLAAMDAGRDIALANKETLVAGGALVQKMQNRTGVNLYPVDSEHSAIFQCLQGAGDNKLRKIILTASGGPFFGKKREELEHITPQQACKHPNWSMGAKISVDSATLMNKGLEFVEAMWLFHLSPEEIEVVVHRESIIHSAVEFADGAVIAQMGTADMRLPIQYALTYPQRMPCLGERLSLTQIGKMTFFSPDYENFPCLAYMIEAAKRGGIYSCAMNSANEEAVAMFLQGKIGFTQIDKILENILQQRLPAGNPHSLEEVLAVDKEIRVKARELGLCKTKTTIGGVTH